MTESSQQPSPLLESLIESLQSLGLEFGSLSEIWRERLFKLSRYSPRLTSFCIANPDYLDSLIERDDLDRRLDKTVLDSRCEALMQTEDDPERALRRFHRLTCRFENGALVQPARVGVSLAIDVHDELFVPTFVDADQ